MKKMHDGTIINMILILRIILHNQLDMIHATGYCY